MPSDVQRGCDIGAIAERRRCYLVVEAMIRERERALAGAAFCDPDSRGRARIEADVLEQAAARLRGQEVSHVGGATSG